MREMVGGCCVCSDDRGWSENPLVYCDGQSCTVAVHQACYGIVSVPTGPWYCRKCESQERAAKVKCELCPSRYGALKRTDNAGWAHVVCALYIPEVRFGNVTTMEPIQLQLIPAERFNKVCYICEKKGNPANASIGACMQCNRTGCKQQFHVTCAQSLGLLCEEAGNYLDNVKYCGYCQHHYSKLKKGGNVKTIPPYKPVSAESQLSDSSSEKESDGVKGTAQSVSLAPVLSGQNVSASTMSTSSGKRKSTGNMKTLTTTSSKSSITPSGGVAKSGSSPKNTAIPTPPSIAVASSTSSSTHHGSKSSDKSKSSKSKNLSATSATNNSNSNDNNNNNGDDRQERFPANLDSKNSSNTNDDKQSAENVVASGKSSKKRKATSRSRTPTPVSSSSSTTVTPLLDTTENVPEKPSDEKIKKPKVETTQSIISNQPIVALTSIGINNIKSQHSSPQNAPSAVSDALNSALVSTSSPISGPITSTGQPSLVVSVPLSSTSLSPRPGLQMKTATSNLSASGNEDHLSNNLDSLNLDEKNQSDFLRTAYEKQESVIGGSGNSVEDMELENNPDAIPAKRTRSQSNDKSNLPAATSSRVTGSKKRTNASLIVNLSNNSNSSNHSINNSNSGTKRLSRTHLTNVTPPPLQHSAIVASSVMSAATTTTTTSNPPGAFSSINQSKPSSSPSSSPGSTESLQNPGTIKMGPSSSSSTMSAMSTTLTKGRKIVGLSYSQNGGQTSSSNVAPPHMLGNQLNPNSNMAQKMTDHLNSELEAHSIFNAEENLSSLTGPQLQHKVLSSSVRLNAMSNSSGSVGATGLSGMLGSGGTNGMNVPQTLDQLLERQWEQGSQFLMEQAQHFDIASLVSCLHQLKAENLRLEEHVNSLLQRRDHLLAVNARLAIPLTGQPATPQSSHPHTSANNIHHAAMAATQGAEISRSRQSQSAPNSNNSSGNSSNVGVSSPYPAHPQGSSVVDSLTLENGLQADSNQVYRRSPTVRLSPASSNNFPMRQNAEAASSTNQPRTQNRQQSFSLYPTKTS